MEFEEQKKIQEYGHLWKDTDYRTIEELEYIKPFLLNRTKHSVAVHTSKDLTTKCLKFFKSLLSTG